MAVKPEGAEYSLLVKEDYIEFGYIRIRTFYRYTNFLTFSNVSNLDALSLEIDHHC